MSKWPTMVPPQEMIQSAVDYVIPNLHRFAQAEVNGTPNDRIRGHIAFLYCQQYFGIPDCDCDLEIDGEADDFDFKVGDRLFDVKSTYCKTYETGGYVPNDWTIHVPAYGVEHDRKRGKLKDWYVRVLTDGEDPRNTTKMILFCACHRTAFENVEVSESLGSKQLRLPSLRAAHRDIFPVVYLWDLVETYRMSGKWTGEERLFARR